MPRACAGRRRAARGRSPGSGPRATGQRGWKRQPDGTSIGFGVSPVRICGTVCVVAGRAAARPRCSAFVYGCCGLRRPPAPAPPRRSGPRYMTAIRSAKWAAVERSCVIMRTPSPSLAQPVEQREDPRPHRDVEHRDGLVGDEQLRARARGRGDRDPLALAAGELVRDSGRRRARAASARPAPAPRAPSPRARPSSRRARGSTQRLLDRVAARGSAGRATRTDPGR